MSSLATRADVPNVTVKDVAKEAGVSIGTVSRVLNGADVGPDFILRVMDAVKKTGYRPNLIAGSLARKGPGSQSFSQKTLQIGYFTNGLENLALEEDQWRYLAGIEQVVTASGRHVLYATFKDELRTGHLPGVIRQQKIDGAILKLGFNEPGLNLAATIAKLMPVVLLGASPDEQFASTILDDTYANFRKVVMHLKDLGHVRIGCFSVHDVGGPPHHLILDERVHAFKAAMNSLGLPCNKRQIYVPERNWQTQTLDDVAEGVIAKISALGANAPTAIVCVSDTHALALYKKAKAAGVKIPGQLSITGHGDMLRHESHAALLTTIGESTFEIGRTAAEVLLAQMEDTQKPIRQVRIAGALIARASTGYPKR